MKRCTWYWVLLCLPSLAGCGDSSGPGLGLGGAGGEGRDLSSVTCIADAECSDGRFCNGAELCEPSSEDADERGCLKARFKPECDDGVECTADSCSDVSEGCQFLAPDVDGDGHRAADCEGSEGSPLGDDCDDADAARFPGSIEVCDPNDRDEDCDSATYGERDRDGDGELDALCCNGEGNERRCGTDCNDLSIAQRSKQPEFCDDVDNDCNGKVDDKAKPVAWYPDGDQDLFGTHVDKPPLSCTPIVGRSILPRDCDDANAARHPAQVELCDFIDNDCDGLSDEPAYCEQGGGIAVGSASGGAGGGPNAVGGSEASGGEVSSSGGGSSTGGANVGGNGSGGSNAGGSPASGGSSAGGTGAGGELNRPGCAKWLFGEHVVRDDGIVIHVAASGAQNAVYDPDGVAPLPGFIDAFEGPTHACGVRQNGEVYCWATVSSAEANNTGQLGSGAVGGVPSAFRASLVTKQGAVPFVTGKVTGQRSHAAAQTERYSCVADSSGELWCWGAITNAANQGAATNSGVAVRVRADASTALNGVKQVAMGDKHVCVVRGGSGADEAWCWGKGANNALGDGTLSDAPYPKKITALLEPVRIFGASQAGCYLAADGFVRCWGDNSFGRLGVASVSAAVANPAVARDGLNAPLGGVTEVATSATWNCYLSAGKVACAGGNVQNYTTYFQLGGADASGIVGVGLRGSSGAGVAEPRMLTNEGDYYIATTKVLLNCATTW